jgi:hypothetical protein
MQTNTSCGAKVEQRQPVRLTKSVRRVRSVKIAALSIELALSRNAASQLETRVSDMM